MSCLALGYSAPSWGAQRLCKVLEGGTADDARARFPLEKSIYTIALHRAAQVLAPRGKDHSIREAGDEPCSARTHARRQRRWEPESCGSPAFSRPWLGQISFAGRWVLGTALVPGWTVNL